MPREPKEEVNNHFYHTLQERWYTAKDHPVALLRAENRIRAPWVLEEIRKHFPGPVSVLDIGCGAGFLSNPLVKDGHQVTGIDLSESSLRVARQFDVTGRARYLMANAYELPFLEQSFDVVCAMDVLEHVEHPQRLIEEASRVLRRGGLFFFHTFNRTLRSYFLVIKGVEWCVANTPPRLHIYPLFIRPKELQGWCEEQELEVMQMRGFAPELFTRAFVDLLRTRNVSDKFSFRFSKGLSTGYCGYAQRK